MTPNEEQIREANRIAEIILPPTTYSRPDDPTTRNLIAHEISKRDERVAELEAKSWRLVEVLKGCVGWIEPVMDGFSVKEDAASRVEVLNKAKTALAEFEKGINDEKAKEG